MARLLRTFVALRCDSSAARTLRRAADRLAALDGSFHPPKTDEFHTTVQFLGGTTEQDLPAIGRALENAAAEVSPFEVSYGGLGAFPSPQRARVVWAATREEPEHPGALAALADAVGRHLGEIGYPPEHRSFHPHVTLGRMRKKPSEDLVCAVVEGASLDFGTELVSELKLILSDPGNRGYTYIDLTTAGLGIE